MTEFRFRSWRQYGSPGSAVQVARPLDMGDPQNRCDREPSPDFSDIEKAVLIYAHRQKDARSITTGACAQWLAGGVYDDALSAEVSAACRRLADRGLLASAKKPRPYVFVLTRPSGADLAAALAAAQQQED